MSLRWTEPAARPCLIETAGHGGTVSLVLFLLAVVLAMVATL